MYGKLKGNVLHLSGRKKHNLNEEGDRQGKLLVLSGSISVGRVGGGG